MSPPLKADFLAEIQLARNYYRGGILDSAFARLERAHILVQ